MNMYQAILFSSDGSDFVTDFVSDTKEQVEDKLANKGSRWFFYPWEFVIKYYPDFLGALDRNPEFFWNKKVLSAPPELEHLKGKTLGTVREWLAAQGEDLARSLGG